MYKTFAIIPQEIDTLFFLMRSLPLALPNRLGWLAGKSHRSTHFCLSMTDSLTDIYDCVHCPIEFQALDFDCLTIVLNPLWVFSIAQGAMSSSPVQVLSQTCGWMKSQASVHQLTSLYSTWGQARTPSETGMPLQLLQTPSVRCWSRGVAIPLTIPAPTPQILG